MWTKPSGWSSNSTGISILTDGSGKTSLSDCTRQLTAGAIQVLNKSFSDLFEGTPLRASRALKPEKNEPELSNMPRLVAGAHRRNFGRLRQLIDAINQAETIGEH